ncbi:MAG: hypothetical protein ACXVCY_13595 [Pseudobdellovibrionaceae bacterium]
MRTFTKVLLDFALILCPLFSFANIEGPVTSTSLLDRDLIGNSNRYGSSYFGYFATQASDLSDGDASIYTYNLFSLNYRLNSRFSTGLKGAFVTESAGTRFGERNSPANTKMADSSISLTDKKPLNSSFWSSSKIVYKLILPTDTDSQKAKTYGALGMDLEFAHDFLQSYAIGYYGKGYVTAQSKAVYVDTDLLNGKIVPTQIGRLEQWLRFIKYFGDKVKIIQGVGLKNSFYNSKTEDQKKNMSYSLLETTITFSVNDNMDLSIGVSQESEQSFGSLQVFNNVETSYLIMASVWM